MIFEKTLIKRKLDTLNNVLYRLLERYSRGHIVRYNGECFKAPVDIENIVSKWGIGIKYGEINTKHKGIICVSTAKETKKTIFNIFSGKTFYLDCFIRDDLPEEMKRFAMAYSMGISTAFGYFGMPFEVGLSENLSAEFINGKFYYKYMHNYALDFACAILCPIDLMDNIEKKDHNYFKIPENYFKLRFNSDYAKKYIRAEVLKDYTYEIKKYEKCYYNIKYSPFSSQSEIDKLMPPNEFAKLCPVYKGKY